MSELIAKVVELAVARTRSFPADEMPHWASDREVSDAIEELMGYDTVVELEWTDKLKEAAIACGCPASAIGATLGLNPIRVFNTIDNHLEQLASATDDEDDFYDFQCLVQSSEAHSHERERVAQAVGALLPAVLAELGVK